MKRIVFVLILLTVLTGIPCTTIAHAATSVPKVTTDNPILLDSDRAILLGASSTYTGLEEKGFYYGLSADKLDVKVSSNSVQRGKMNVLITGLMPETTYYFCAFVRTRSNTHKGEVVAFTTPAVKQWTATEAIFSNSDDRYRYIFGTTEKYYKMSSPPWGYNGSHEAAKHMVTITVPIWKLSHAKKIPSIMSVTVHYKLEAQVKAIFNEIYELDEQFPIMRLSGYSYRRMVVPWVKSNSYMSQHSFGTCIDMNKPYNLFYRYKDKRNKKSPYYIPENVILIFEKYGWTWGGDFKEGLDTMHFQYLGPELMG